MATNEPVPGGASAIDTEDVVELILADHREFERLLRALRDRGADRAGLRRELADLLVAHAVAEEEEVYPELRKAAPEEAEEIEHGVEEHAEGHEALLGVLEADPEDDDAFEEALEALSEALTHHMDEEERDVLNAAREEVGDEDRARLGRAFLGRRDEALDGSPGDPRNVGRLVQEAREEGLLD